MNDMWNLTSEEHSEREMTKCPNTCSNNPSPGKWRQNMYGGENEKKKKVVGI